MLLLQGCCCSAAVAMLLLQCCSAAAALLLLHCCCCNVCCVLVQVRSNIPYQVIGGTPFWTRKEVKDLMAYVKLAISPEDDLSLMRTINQPTRGIGAESQTKLKAWAEGQGLSLGQALFPHFQVSFKLMPL